MPALTLPEIFYKGWFWLAIAIPVAIILHFLKKKSPPPFPGTGNVFVRHKVKIRKALDVFLIILILCCWLLLLSFAVKFFQSPSPPESNRPEIQQLKWSMLLIPLIVMSGQSSLLLGLLSFFHENLTKIKRLILLIACLLPVVFTILLLMIDKTPGRWSIIQFCLLGSFLSWIINAPAIFAKKPFFKFTGDILRKLMLGYHSR